MRWSAVYRALNQQPGEDRGADVTRIRLAFLEGLGSSLRQNILLSAYPFAELNALVHRQCSSASGTARLKHQHLVRCPEPASLLSYPAEHLAFAQNGCPDMQPRQLDATPAGCLDKHCMLLLLSCSASSDCSGAKPLGYILDSCIPYPVPLI